MLQRSKVSSKRIWIDLDNSPHVPFFAPIIEELERRGCAVTVTARDAYQVRDLADFFHLKYMHVGRHYGKHKVFKIMGTCFRALQLLAVVRKQKPHLAIAHGSRSQTLASILARIPSLAIFDYEFVNTSALFKATWLLMPEVVRSSIQFTGNNLLTYPGIKEDVYAPNFTPDPKIVSELQLSESDVIVTLRPPATEAHYHKPESDDLFDAVMELLAQTPNVKAVLLPRNARQAIYLRQTWHGLLSAGKIVIPQRALDGLNLIWYSDLVISGGGTMNREAAALGVPVYSIFRGKTGAVDRNLADTGRLVLLESVEDVRTKVVLRRRVRPVGPAGGRSLALTAIADHIVSLVEGDTITRSDTLTRSHAVRG